MSISTNAPISEIALLDLFRNELRRRLVGEAMDAIRPQVIMHVEAVIKELEPVLRTHYEPMMNDLIVQIKINDPTKNESPPQLRG